MERKPNYVSGERSRAAHAGRTVPAGHAAPYPRRPSGESRAPQGRDPRRAERRPDARRAAPDGRARQASRRPAQDNRPQANRRPPASQPPRRNPPRRRKRDPLSIIMPILILAGILAGLVYVGSTWLIATVNRSTFCDNVYINNIPLTDCTLAEAPAFLEEQISQRLNTSYTLTLDGKTWTFTPAHFNASVNTGALIDRAWNFGHVGNIFDRTKSIRSLKEFPIYLTAPLQYDDALIDAFVDQLYSEVYIAPTDATVVVDMEKPYLTSESTRGQELDKETAKAQIISLIETGEGSTELPMIVLEPALSTEDALSTLEVSVEYSTDVSARNWNSRYNVRKALSYFNGLTVYPGNTVDFNAIVGPRTEERGWKSATEYIGNTTQEGFGGGVCQASTTLYGAMLKSGMTIIERHPHSMTVAYVDPSLDAAVADISGKNLIFRNDTDYAIRIYTEVTKETATVTIYGRKPEYRYELYSNIVSQDSTAVRVSYIDDTEGKHCYYTSDPPVLYKKGNAALISDGYLIAYDWDTNQEVFSTWLSHDQYDSGTDIYWRGVHSYDEVGAGALDFNFTTSTESGGE